VHFHKFVHFHTFVHFRPCAFPRFRIFFVHFHTLCNFHIFVYFHTFVHLRFDGRASKLFVELWRRWSSHGCTACLFRALDSAESYQRGKRAVALCWCV
jgi:hypothetical protein